MTNKHLIGTRGAQHAVALASLCRLFVLAGALSVTLATDCVHAKKPKANEIDTDSRKSGSVALLAHVRLSNAGIGFDDMLYAPALNRVLVPAANAGYVALIEPLSGQITRAQAPDYAPQAYRGGHDEGITSADSDGKQWIFAADRSSMQLLAFNSQTLAVVSRAALDGSPDYVRYIPSADEVWVTEPEREQIEIFAAPRARAAAPKAIAKLKVAGGPESLVVDEEAHRAYTHLWKGKTVVIDTKRRELLETYSNGCQSSRGIAIDLEAHLLFAGCSDGRVTVLDLKHAGKLVGSAPTSAGVDIIAYNSQLRHLYAPSASSGQMAVFSVERSGALHPLGHAQTAAGSHCVASDNSTKIWVCAPEQGELLVFGDTLR